MKRLILTICLLTAPLLGQAFEQTLYKLHGEH
jgi:hypothetical protein